MLELLMTDRGEYAKVIADSINDEGVRLTTFEVRFWRPVLAEFNTHCVLSRNSASSRAIPFRKQLAKVWREPATPIAWPLEQKGMQGGDDLPVEQQTLAKHHWLRARDYAVDMAQELATLGVHKSVTNRLVEPFMWHTAVVTATAWENFFEQRCSPLAQPEIRAVAELMRDAREDSEPIHKKENAWHLPYLPDEDQETWKAIIERGDGHTRRVRSLAVMVSAARCARVSYLTQDGTRDIEKDLELYDRLVTARPAHWSPLEHVATPWLENRQLRSDHYLEFEGLGGETHRPEVGHLPRIGKLLTWRTLRTTVDAEQGAVTFR
jgi:hypothetical protein